MESIQVKEEDEIVLEAFCNVDHAGWTKTKSTTEYIIKYANGPTAWSSKKQSYLQSKQLRQNISQQSSVLLK